jgi:hypothetical protein
VLDSFTKCDCKYNENCHGPRQYVQQRIRERCPEKKVEDCDFYVMISDSETNERYDPEKDMEA